MWTNHFVNSGIGRKQMKKTKKIILILLALTASLVITTLLIFNRREKEFTYRTEIKDAERAKYFNIPDKMIINDAEDALAIGTIILKSNFDYLTDQKKSKNLYYDVVETIVGDESYWRVYAYHALRGYDVYGQCATVTFRKSDCQIVDMGMR